MDESRDTLLTERPPDDAGRVSLDFRRMPLEAVRLAKSAWFLAHTKPRQEKLLAESLAAAGVPCFLPVVPLARFYGHRKRIVEAPVFPSYLFVHADSDGRIRTLQSKRVVNVVRVLDQSTLEHELQQIDIALASGARLDPFPYLCVGRRVVVVRGPFVGLHGLIDERRSWDRLVLNVSMLGRATCLEIDASVLEPAD